MKKFLLATFMAFDLAIAGGSAVVLFAYLSHAPWAPLAMKITTTRSIPAAKPGAAAEPGLLSPGAGTPTITTPAPAANAESSSRKILFSYHNPHAKIVSIRADFTGWKAEPMQKNESGSWTYQATLTPGEYAYCYTVDDKTFKDPANKKTKQIGRTLVSAISVESLPAAALAK